MKYILYARKSTEEDDRQILSIEAQLVELQEYAAKEKLEIIASFCEANQNSLTFPTWCSRQESNLHQSLRRALFYPLNYGSKRGGMKKLVYSLSPSADSALQRQGANEEE